MTAENFYTLFGPALDDPIKCSTMADVRDWFDLFGPFEVNPDEAAPETWDFAGGWFLEYNDGSHMEPERWEALRVHSACR